MEAAKTRVLVWNEFAVMKGEEMSNFNDNKLSPP